MNLLQRRIGDLIKLHGSTRAAAAALEIDHAYLWRLQTGEKDNPDDAVLKKLGLRRIVTYKELIA